MALQSLNAAGRDLQAVQNRISTGLKVSGPKDNGAVFAIAQSMKSEIAGWQSVDASLARGQSVLDVASAGTEGIVDVVADLQQRAMAFKDASNGPSRAAIRADIEALIRQIDQIANTSTFDTVNLLTGRPSIKTETTSVYRLSPSSLAPPDFRTTMAALPPGSSAFSSQTPTFTLPPGTLTPPSFATALATITGTNSQTVVVDAGTVAGRVSLLIDAYGVPDIAEIWQDGQRVAASGQPVGVGGASVGPGIALPNAQVLSFDYVPGADTNIELRFNENVSISGTAWRVGGLVMGDPSDPVPVPVPTISTSTSVRTAAEFDPPRVTANPEQVAQSLGQSPENTTAEYILHGGLVAGRVDMLFDAFGIADTVEIIQGGVRRAASGQTYVAGSGAVGPGQAVTGQQVISFDYDPGDGPITFRFNEGASDPDSAWVVGALTLRPATDPLPAAQFLPSGRYIPGFSPINYDVLSAPQGETIRLSSRDLTPAGLGLDPIDWENPAQMLDAITSARGTVIEAASYFDLQSNRIERTRIQASRLTDALDTGVGNLVDADLAKDAARLQAAQIRQQLAVQTLAIANDSPQWLLSLFRS